MQTQMHTQKHTHSVNEALQALMQVDMFTFQLLEIGKVLIVTGPPGALSFDVKPEIAQRKSL